MKRNYRARPSGWRNESHRHYLAAKGIKTNRYMARMNESMPAWEIEARAAMLRPPEMRRTQDVHFRSEMNEAMSWPFKAAAEERRNAEEEKEILDEAYAEEVFPKIFSGAFSEYAEGDLVAIKDSEGSFGYVVGFNDDTGKFKVKIVNEDGKDYPIGKALDKEYYEDDIALFDEYYAKKGYFEHKMMPETELELRQFDKEIALAKDIEAEYPAFAVEQMQSNDKKGGLTLSQELMKRRMNFNISASAREAAMRDMEEERDEF